MKRTTLAAMTLFALATAAPAASAAAQHADPPARRSVAAYLMTGGSLLDVDALNIALAAQAFETFSDRFFSLGGGIHLVLNQAIITGEAHALLTEEGSVSNGTYTGALGSMYGSLGAGYLVYEGDALDLYPLVGVGWERTTLELVQRGAPAFGDVLTDPARGSTLHASGPIVSFSLGGDYVFEAGPSARKGFLIGLRAGYAYAPVQGDWSLGDIDVPDGPAMNVTGPFVHIMIGLGGRGPRLFEP